MNRRTQKIVANFIAIENGAMPDGHYDKHGLWYPDAFNVCPACASIQPPSEKWRYSWLKHCKTATHHAKLLGVSLAEFNRLTRIYKSEIEEE